jgi:hypothetical protein
MQCHGMTKKGAICTKKVTNENKYCYLHLEQDEKNISDDLEELNIVNEYEKTLDNAILNEETELLLNNILDKISDGDITTSGYVSDIVLISKRINSGYSKVIKLYIINMLSNQISLKNTDIQDEIIRNILANLNMTDLKY